MARYLYNVIRRPIYNEDILKNRNNMINLVMKRVVISQDILKTIQMILSN